MWALVMMLSAAGAFFDFKISTVPQAKDNMDGLSPPAAPSPFVLFSMQRLKFIRMNRYKMENHHFLLIYERVHIHFENQFTDFFNIRKFLF